MRLSTHWAAHLVLTQGRNHSKLVTKIINIKNTSILFSRVLSDSRGYIETYVPLYESGTGTFGTININSTAYNEHMLQKLQ
jgi:hypothetical protein